MTQKIKVINKGKSFKKKDYPGVFGDYDKDGVLNIDDISPLDKSKKGKVEPIPVAAVFETLIELKSALDSTMYDSIDKLKKASPPDADIYARTKTPYSIVKKLVQKRLLNPTKGLTDLVGTTIAVNSYKELIKVRDQIRKGLLGKVLEEEDMYESPKQGYMAYHYIVEVNKIPVEVQLKTKRTKDINELTHEPYKKGTINEKNVLDVMEIVNKADKGDKKAISEYNKIIKDKKKLAKSFDNSYAKGGEIDYFEHYDKLPPKARKIYEKFEDKIVMGDFDYADSGEFLKEMEAEGFTFEYGLGNEPYNLRKMAKGGLFGVFPDLTKKERTVVAKAYGMPVGNMKQGGNINSKVNALKKGDIINIEFGSSFRKDNKVTLKVRSRNKVRKYGNFKCKDC